MYWGIALFFRNNSPSILCCSSEQRNMWICQHQLPKKNNFLKNTSWWLFLSNLNRNFPYLNRYEYNHELDLQDVFWMSYVRSVYFLCVCVCVCVCVRARACVCVCVFILFHREGFFRLQDVQDIPEGTDQRSCVVNISWLRYAKFHHRRIWKCHISPPKTKTPAALLLERKRYEIIRSAKRWYILI